MTGDEPPASARPGESEAPPASAPAVPSARASGAAEAPPAPRASGGVVEWLLRRRAIAEAERAPDLTAEQRTCLRRARRAAELASQTLDPVEPLRYGDGAPLATSLYREAAYWALRARAADGPRPPDLAAALAAAPGAFARAAGGDEGRQADVRRVLLERTFVDAADDEPGRQRADAELLAAFVESLLEPLVRSRAMLLGRLRWQRGVRLGLVAVVAAALALLAPELPWVLRRRAGDLARGKDWRASSAHAGFQGAGRVGAGAPPGSPFFHTLEEEGPWMQIDLGGPQTVAAFDVRNRTDCCFDRALPLVVETSNDEKQWAPVATRESTFRTWRTTFEPRQARFVRLRVPRRTFFHLERVSLYSR
jgi:hypothetical protein